MKDSQGNYLQIGDIVACWDNESKSKIFVRHIFNIVNMKCPYVEVNRFCRVNNNEDQDLFYQDEVVKLPEDKKELENKLMMLKLEML